ncbi:arylsulfatase I isoform X2 [Eurytemora carolleeae]|nr:arylsulfatase I isoform X2 [Eurytemora carolleeae]|eukprot:XP_023334285.1 arylsulfatase I-like isoform X2 [Eurytemora affinis]
MKKEGYQTHALGKWHLGFCSEDYTPTQRGFDTFHGLFVGDDTESLADNNNLEKEISKEKKKKTEKKRTRKIRKNRNTRSLEEEEGEEEEDNDEYFNAEEEVEEENFDFDIEKDSYTLSRTSRKLKELRPKTNTDDSKIDHMKKKEENKKKKEIRNKKKEEKMKKKKTKKNKNKDLYDSSYYAKKVVEIFENKDKNIPVFLYMSFLSKMYPRTLKLKQRGQMIKKIQEKRGGKIQELDDAVGMIVEGLKKTEEFENTIILFISDNGARAFTSEAPEIDNPNYPLKGSKGSVYEGGTKVPGFIFSPKLERFGSRYSKMIHFVDILPTILSAVGTNTRSLPIDGVDHWSALEQGVQNGSGPRNTMIYNLDDNFVQSVLRSSTFQPKFQIGIREGDYKLIWGQSKSLHRSYRDAKDENGINLDAQIVELYNLEQDAGEQENLAPSQPEIVRRLQILALQYTDYIIPPRFMGLQTTDRVVDPTLVSGGITGWCKGVERTECQPSSTRSFYQLSSSTMVEVYYGSLRNQSLSCTTYLH